MDYQPFFKLKCPCGGSLKESPADPFYGTVLTCANCGTVYADVDDGTPFGPGMSRDVH